MTGPVLVEPLIMYTCPVGVPDVAVTVPLNVTLWLRAEGTGEGPLVIVVVVLAKLAGAHFVSKFATLTEPNPVARS
jgi:hypothetical protein